MPSWTCEQVERLRTMWDEGLTASEIAEALGELFTRSAVLGKIHRLGGFAKRTRAVPKRISTRRRREKRSGEKRIRTRHQHFVKPKSKPIPEAPPKHYYVPPPERAPVPSEAPKPLRLSIFDLRDGTEFRPGTCKYSVTNSSPHEFCGHPTVTGSVYCDYHKGVCTTEPCGPSKRRLQNIRPRPRHA